MDVFLKQKPLLFILKLLDSKLDCLNILDFSLLIRTIISICFFSLKVSN